MEVSTAIRLVNAMKFRPGWKLYAYEASEWFEPRGSILVMTEVDTYDTRFRDQSGNLTSPFTLDGFGAYIDVRDLDEAGLAYAILTQVVRVLDDHEDRELLVFKQEDGSWVAPLHPHTVQGRQDWNRLAA